jgi:hypothetical protein
MSAQGEEGLTGLKSKLKVISSRIWIRHLGILPHIFRLLLIVFLVSSSFTIWFQPVRRYAARPVLEIDHLEATAWLGEDGGPSALTADPQILLTVTMPPMCIYISYLG